MDIKADKNEVSVEKLKDLKEKTTDPKILASIAEKQKYVGDNRYIKK